LRNRAIKEAQPPYSTTINKKPQRALRFHLVPLQLESYQNRFCVRWLHQLNRIRSTEPLPLFRRRWSWCL